MGVGWKAERERGGVRPGTAVVSPPKQPVELSSLLCTHLQELHMVKFQTTILITSDWVGARHLILLHFITHGGVQMCSCKRIPN